MFIYIFSLLYGHVCFLLLLLLLSCRMPVHTCVAECVWNGGYACHWGHPFFVVEAVPLVELPKAIQVFVVVSLVCRALLFPFVCCFMFLMEYLSKQCHYTWMSVNTILEVTFFCCCWPPLFVEVLSLLKFGVGQNIALNGLPTARNSVFLTVYHQFPIYPTSCPPPNPGRLQA